jgi:hypothetical protein
MENIQTLACPCDQTDFDVNIDLTEVCIMSNKFLSATLLSLSISTAVTAGPINVGGVVWDPDSAADFQSNGNTYETFAGNVGETVSGFGTINQFNGTLADTFCPAGCELTYTFSLQLAAATDLSVGGGPNLFVFDFNNITFDMFVDSTPDYDQLAPSFASAADGVLFLSAVNNGNLTGTAANLFDVNNINGSGNGFLDVTGGLAFENFDTNTKANSSDLQFTSSFQTSNIDVIGFPLFGSLDLGGQTAATVAEPSTLALLSLGILGFGFTARRKSAK